MLTMMVLNSDAALNSYVLLPSFSFIAGADIKLNLKLFQVDEPGLRYIPEDAATITMDLLKADGTTLTKTASFPFADDRSIIQFEITAAESVDIISQNLVVKVDESSGIDFALLQFGLRRTITTSDC